MSELPFPDRFDTAVAVIGLAGRFPGAGTVDELWRNLRQGVESISRFTVAEAIEAGADPALVARPDWVLAEGILEGAASFDAEFFGIGPREATLTDPQHRQFLMTAWAALENAGYEPRACGSRVGVYAGSGLNGHLSVTLADPRFSGPVDLLSVALGSDKDHLCPYVSYALDLRGPSVVIQTACSTSLVAVHLACQALLTRECDLALAGGVSIRVPSGIGYLYVEGGPLSPDGRCRPFDAQARGTVSGSGVGVVVLKRLADAVAGNDSIRAVILGSAVNNDGAGKAGYTAPSPDGQASVIVEALAASGVEAGTIGYVETHGTGTILGDPIEVSALTQAYRTFTPAAGFCALGSVKANIGHLDAAAGVAGLIKAILALESREKPPLANFERANPEIDLPATPFYVPTRLENWPAGSQPRRAAVSSFGLGGTNVHVVLEEAPPSPPGIPGRPWQLLTLSARTPAALEKATAVLVGHLDRAGSLDLADAAYTLQTGRRAFEHRRFVVCRDAAGAADSLRRPEAGGVLGGRAEGTPPSLVFLFPGQGTQHSRMAAGLHRDEPRFRDHFDQCESLLLPHLDSDLRASGLAAIRRGEAGEAIHETRLTQPALFTVEYALARTLMDWGLKPEAMLGHSLGEYVAACLAGVFSLEDALALVSARGRLLESIPAGVMLVVPLPEAETRALLEPGQSVAAVNGPSNCVVAGPAEAAETLRERLRERRIETRLVRTSRAFHSPAVEPVLDQFRTVLSQIPLNRPLLRYISNLTGDWVRASETTDTEFWLRHLRSPVRFADGARRLLAQPRVAFVEVGPGHTLSGLVRQMPEWSTGHFACSTLPHPRDEQADDYHHLLSALGGLWLEGVAVDWRGLHGPDARRRVPLPAYPFEGRPYVVAGAAAEIASPAGRSLPPRGGGASAIRERQPLDKWLYVPSWKKALPSGPVQPPDHRRWLAFVHPSGLGAELADRLRARGYDVTPVLRGEIGDGPDAYGSLVAGLKTQGRLPDKIVHLWGATPPEFAPGWSETQALGFYSLLFLAQALAKEAPARPVEIVVVSGQAEATGLESKLRPERAALGGLVRVLAQEYSNLSVRAVDVDFAGGPADRDGLVERLLAEIIAGRGEAAVALRGRGRWIEVHEPIQPDVLQWSRRLRPGGVYLITGGLGRIGLVLSRYLAAEVEAKLILTTRSASSAAHRSAALREIEGLGGEVTVAQVDATDEAAMRALVDETVSRLGGLHGVIHAAFAEDVCPVTEATLERCERQFAPKVQGAAVLARILEDRDIDFCLLMSSLASTLGGLGFAAYAAANRVLDLMAHQQRDLAGRPWLAVNWDAWAIPTREGETPSELALTPEEGIEVFRRILAAPPLAQLAVSTTNLEERLWARGATSYPTRALGERPGLHTPYVAPRTPAEETIAGLFAEVLGFQQVGVNDSFFDLGGDSLMGTQLLGRLRQAFSVDVPMRSVFEGPTPARLAEAILAAGSESGEQTRLGPPAGRQQRAAELLGRLEDLSDEEVDKLLREELALDEQ